MKKYFRRSYVLRYLVIVLVLCVTAMGMTIMRLSQMGTEPFSCLNYAISEHFHVPMGMTIIVINLVLLVFTYLNMKESLGFGTFANMFLIGNFADFWMKILKPILSPFATTMISRLFMLCIGMVIMVFACSFYLAGMLGMAPYDSFAYVLEKMTKGKFPFKWARVFTDSLCVFIAFLIARTNRTQWQIIGIGTIIMAFFIGPLPSFFRERIADPFMKMLKNLPS